MAWSATLLEDSLDPWLAIEPDATRRRGAYEELAVRYLFDIQRDRRFGG